MRLAIDPHRKCADYAQEDPDYLCGLSCPAMDNERRARIRAVLRQLFPDSAMPDSFHE